MACNASYPWGEGNPWRAEDVRPKELLKVLWAIGADPDLEIVAVVARGARCFTVIWRNKD